MPGGIYHQLPPGGGFTYFKDEAKTQKNRVGDYFTMGDVGYFDEDGYLFLTGRDAETIISGGVNIYPQEVDNELIKHEAVADSSTIGVPHDEWGEQVKAVIMLKPGYAAVRPAGPGNPGLRPRQPARLQGPAQRRLRHRPAPLRSRQDPAQQGPRPLLGRPRAADLTSRSRPAPAPGTTPPRRP